MGKADDWFRNDRWGAAEEAAFHARLVRSKSVTNKARYAGIKALMLEESGDPERIRAAIGLLERILHDWPSDYEIASHYAQLGRC